MGRQRPQPVVTSTDAGVQLVDSAERWLPLPSPNHPIGVGNPLKVFRGMVAGLQRAHKELTAVVALAKSKLYGRRSNRG